MTSTALPLSGTIPLLLFLAKATLLLIVALLAAIPLRHSTAGARHLVWLAALVGVLALPVLTRIPTLRLGVLPSTLDVRGDAIATRRSVDAEAAAPVLARWRRGGLSTASSVGPLATPTMGRRTPRAHVATVLTPTPDSGVLHSEVSITELVAIIWSSVALVLLGWVAAGAFTVRRIVDDAMELTSPDWMTPLCEVADRLDLELPPRLVLSDRIEMAFACRATSPTIVLPAAAETWSDDRRRAVLFHELAHIKRHDLLGHTLGRVACGLYWFHPLVWTAAKNLRAEGERACDDLVLSCGARPSEYAQHLLDMVTSVRDLGAPAMSLPMARKKEFEGRMLAILDPRVRRTAPGRVQSGVVVLVVGALALTIAAVAPATSPTPATFPTAATPATPTVPATPLAVPALQAPAAIAEPVVVAEPSPALQRFAHRFADGHIPARGEARHTVRAELAAPREGSVDTARVELLIKVLTTDADGSVRRSAAWGLHDVQSASARLALIKALRSDTDESVREMAAWSLAEYDDASDVASALGQGAREKDARVRMASIWAIGTIGAAQEADAVEDALIDSDARIREIAIWSLAQLDVHRAPVTLVNALTDRSTQVRKIAAWALGQMGDSSATRALASAFQSEPEASVRVAEMWALSNFGSMPRSVIDAALASKDPEMRRRAVGMLAGGGEGEAWPWPWPWPWPRPTP